MAGASTNQGRLDVGDVGLTRDDLPPIDNGPIDLRTWFDEARRDRPIDLEIGSGKGTFLVQQSELEPDVNYIGIEWARAYWRHAADRLRRHGRTNVRMLHTDAAVFVRRYVPDRSLRQVHIYFPDPWPKARHHKRRLIQAPFLEHLHRVLVDPPSDGQLATWSGCVRIATDHQEYFQWMVDELAKVASLFDRLPFERPASAGEGELVGTNFERKYRREGRPFLAMILRKRL